MKTKWFAYSAVVLGFLLAACGSDSEEPGPINQAGGSGGSAGKSGNGGTAGSVITTGGQSGSTMGTSGTSGASGAGLSGSSGTSGASGTSGSAGSSGSSTAGSAGSGTAGTGTAGTGTAGTGTAGTGTAGTGTAGTGTAGTGTAGTGTAGTGTAGTGTAGTGTAGTGTAGTGTAGTGTAGTGTAGSAGGTAGAGGMGDPCMGVTCNMPDMPSCNGDVLTSYSPVGVCMNMGGMAQCTYTPITTNCAATPGFVCQNGGCSLKTYAVDWCRLQFPESISTTPGGADETVYGRLFISGLTDVNTAGNDPNPSVMGQLGVGPDGSDPDGNTNWTWTDAIPNVGWLGVGEPNNDEYQATLTPNMSGSFDYAYRFSGDGGTTWTYCDKNAGSGSDGAEDGYQIANAGSLEVVGDPTVLYFSEYVEGSGSEKALEIYNPTSAKVSLENCSIKIYANGSPTSSGGVNLTGQTINGMSTFVIVNTSGTATIKAFANMTSALGYNGNDAVELVCNGNTMDVIGQIGNNPGSAWGSGQTSTADKTLRRKTTVTQGDTNGADAFDPAVEWDGFDQNTFDNLGMYP
jgi:hypothetical protein